MERDMNKDAILPILQLVIWLTTNYPAMAAAVQDIIDHGSFTPEEAAAFRARMEERFASEDWQVTP
jgi:hypothetical protein